jgi:hypothetical protein
MKMASHHLPLSRLLAILLMLCAVGCTVLFVSPYDEKFDQGVSDLQQKTEVFLAKIAKSKATHSNSGDFYTDARGEIEALRSRALVYGEDKNKGTLAELDLLQKAFEQMEQYHRAGPITGSGYEAMRNTLGAHFRALLQIEVHKKRSLNH